MVRTKGPGYLGRRLYLKHCRGIKIFLLIIVILLVTLLVAVWIMFGTKIQAAMTIDRKSVV